jgi:hypothetical protein
LGLGVGLTTHHLKKINFLRTIDTSLGPGRILWINDPSYGIWNLGEVGWGDVDWIGLAQDRNRWRALVNSVLNLRVP